MKKITNNQLLKVVSVPNIVHIICEDGIDLVTDRLCMIVDNIEITIP